MQFHRILLTASVFICSLGLAVNSTEASVIHVGGRTSPHVHVPRMSPHVHRSVTHPAAQHASKRTPTHSQPVKSVPKSKAKAMSSSSVKSLTKSNKPLLFAAESPSKQLRLARSAKRFTRQQASRVFAANRVSPVYQTVYRRQSIIRNPWLWLFMINHHRISQQTQADAQYLKGYRYGMQQGQKDLKAHSRQHQKLTADQERMHNTRWQKGYYHGYQDAVAPTSKSHQPVSAAAN